MLFKYFHPLNSATRAVNKSMIVFQKAHDALLQANAKLESYINDEMDVIISANENIEKANVLLEANDNHIYNLKPFVNNAC